MLRRNKNVAEVAGGTFSYRIRIMRSGRRVGFTKLYGAKMFIGRQGCRDPTIHADGIFDPIERNFIITFPAEKTREMVGNYTYHILVTTPSGEEIINTFGSFHVLPLIE